MAGQKTHFVKEILRFYKTTATSCHLAPFAIFQRRNVWMEEYFLFVNFTFFLANNNTREKLLEDWTQAAQATISSWKVWSILEN